MTYPFIYFGAGGAEQCGEIGPSNYLANNAYAGSMVSAIGDPSTRKAIFFKRQTSGNQEKFTLFATFRRTTLSRDSVSDRVCTIISPEAASSFSTGLGLVITNEDKLQIRNVWDDGTQIKWESNIRLVDTDSFYNIIVAVDGKTKATFWVNGIQVATTRTVYNQGTNLLNTPRFNDSRYDICVGGTRNLTNPNSSASPENPEWPFRGEICIAGLIDGVYLENPTRLGFFDDRTDEWVPIIPDLINEKGNSFLLVGRDQIIKDGFRHYMIGGKPNELNTVSPNQDPIGMVWQFSYVERPDAVDIFSPIIGDNTALSVLGYKRKAVHTFSSDGRLLSQPDPYGLQPDGNTKSLIAGSDAATLVFPNSADKGMRFFKYTGTNVRQAIPHGLGKVPDMVMIIPAKAIGTTAENYPYIWTKGGGDIGGRMIKSGANFINGGDATGMFLANAMDDTNIHIDKWIDPTTMPSNTISTRSGKGRHHDSAIFTVGSVTYMALMEFSDAVDPNTGGGIFLYELATDGKLTQLDTKAHGRITFGGYFSLGSDHYIIVNQRTDQPTIDYAAGRVLIYQINTATKKLGTLWTSPERKDCLSADWFVDGNKLVVTIGTGNTTPTAAFKTSVTLDFDETNGFHNSRASAQFDNHGVCRSFVVGSERYLVAVSGVHHQGKAWNAAEATGTTRLKVAKWQTGSRTWSGFDASKEFVAPAFMEHPEFFTHNGRIYMVFTANVGRYAMFDEEARRAVYLYEFEIAKMRFKILDTINQSGAAFVRTFTQDGKAYITVGGRDVFKTTGYGSGLDGHRSLLYVLGQDGNYLESVQLLSSVDVCTISSGLHSNGKRFAVISNVDQVNASGIASSLLFWDSDFGAFKGHFTGSVNQLNEVGTEYFVCAFSNSDTVTVDRVATTPWRQTIPGITHTFLEDGERYFVTVTQALNMGLTATAAQLAKFGKIVTYQYCKHRGTLVPIHDLDVVAASVTKWFERGGERYMVTEGIGKDHVVNMTADLPPTVWKWDKVKRIWTSHQTLAGFGAPTNAVEKDGKLFIGFYNRHYALTATSYPALWRWNDTSKVFEAVTAAVSTQKHQTHTGNMFVKNGKLWTVLVGKYATASATMHNILLFEVNEATGVHTNVQIKPVTDLETPWTKVAEVEGYTFLIQGADNNTGNVPFGLYRFDTATERFVDFYVSFTTDNTANPIVDYVEHNGRHLFLFPAYNGNASGKSVVGATTIIEYDKATDSAYVASTFYTSGLIQLVPFKEDGKLKFATMFYHDINRRPATIATNEDVYMNAHSNISVYDENAASIQMSFHNQVKTDNDFVMLFCKKEALMWAGPDFYYDMSQASFKKKYLLKPDPLTGGLGEVAAEGGIIYPMGLPAFNERGYSLSVHSDKWIGGFEVDQRTGNKFAVQLLHGGGMLSTASNPYNKTVKFSENTKLAGKDRTGFYSSWAGQVMFAKSGTTGFTATPYVIPGYASGQKQPLYFEAGYTVDATSHSAFGLTTIADQTFANAAIRAVSPLAGGTGLVHNTAEFNSGDTAGFLLDYETRTITLYNNGVKDVVKPMPAEFMCFFVDVYEAVATGTDLWFAINMGARRFNFPPVRGVAPTSDNTKEAYPIVRARRFFADGFVKFDAVANNTKQITTEFSPDLVMLWDDGNARKFRWFYRGWGDNAFYSGQDFNGSLGTVSSGGISGFSWEDRGLMLRRNTDTAWSGTEFIHYLAWEASRCSGMELIEYVGTATDMVLNLNNIEGTPDAVLILSKDDAANRPNLFSTAFDTPARNYLNLHTAAGIQLNATTLLTFGDKKVTIPSNPGYNQTGKTYLAVVFKSVPGFSYIGAAASNGEVDNANFAVGVNPLCSFGVALNTGATMSVRHTSPDTSNPGTQYAMTNSGKNTASSMEFHSTGVKFYISLPAGQKLFTMMWGAPWVYGNAH